MTALRNRLASTAVQGSGRSTRRLNNGNDGRYRARTPAPTPTAISIPVTCNKVYPSSRYS